MACHHPLRAWRTRAGIVRLNKELPDAEPLALPCGGCLGCRTEAAQAWALRCHLELHAHRAAVFTTLTYDDDHCPPSLRKRDLQLFLKRLRRAAEPLRLRFFASGEYGETTARPHYHAILFGPQLEQGRRLVDNAWRDTDGRSIGFTETAPVTPARIAYCAGYTSKKIGFKREPQTRVDENGEEYEWEPPFIQMSRQPGIGGHAREHTQSWRAYAVHNGKVMPAPKFYHEAWKRTATAHMLEDLELERQQRRTTKSPITPQVLAANEAIAVSRQAMRATKRKL